MARKKFSEKHLLEAPLYLKTYSYGNLIICHFHGFQISTSTTTKELELIKYLVQSI